MRLTISTLALFLSITSAFAQAPEGTFRLERTDAHGRPSAGLVVVSRTPQGLTYERRTRDTLDVPCVVERGTARVEGGALLLTPERSGIVSALPGAAAPQDARFAASGGAWSRTGERLVPIARDTAGHELRLFIDGAAFDAVRTEISAARTSVDFQVFNYADDATGRSVADVLMGRARAGVPVRLLVDRQSNLIGTLVHGRAYVDIKDGLGDELKVAGVDFRQQHYLGESLKSSFGNWGRRIADLGRRVTGRPPAPPRENRGYGVHDHRKLVVVDRRVGFLGGQNVGHDYETSWHDCQARLEGPGVNALEALFADRWASAGGPAGPALTAAAVGPGDVQVEVLGSLPGLPDAIDARYAAELDQARTSAFLALGFVTDEAQLDRLAGVARRGGRAVLLLPGDDENVNKVARDTIVWVRNDLIRAGIEVYTLRDRMLHMKLGLFDGRTVIVGSDNLSGSNLAESVAVVTDPRFARDVQARVFDVDLPNAIRQVERKLPWREKLKVGFNRFVLGALM